MLALIVSLFSLVHPALATNLYTPMNCVQEAAQVDPGITRGLVNDLCGGARSPHRAACYKQAWTQNQLTRGLAIDLCKRANTDGPAACYNAIAGVDKEITVGLAIQLCSDSISSDATISCYQTAARYRFSRGLAIDLCRYVSDAAVLTACVDQGAAASYTVGQIIELCRQQPGCVAPFEAK